jgi:rod shape-determining protein MreC
MAPPRNRRPGFSRRAQYGLFFSYVVAAVGVGIAAVLLVMAQVNPTAFAALRSAMAELTAPISSGGAAIERAIAGVPAAIGNYFHVMHENRQLRAQLTRQHDLLMRARTLSYDNRRLRHLLQLRDRTGGTITAARLVSSSASSTRRFALLNAGGRQGVRAGQPVSGPDGLIGRVLETGPDTARVLLLGDAESAVPVRRTRDGVPAIANGRGDGMLDIRAISLGDTVFKAGDVLVTSGTGGLYPPNIPVARIIRRTRDGALAIPFEQPDTLDFAIVQHSFFRAPPPAAPVPPQ